MGNNRREMERILFLKEHIYAYYAKNIKGKTALGPKESEEALVEIFILHHFKYLDSSSLHKLT